MLPPGTDIDAVRAVAELCGRAGARHLELGYLHEGVPLEEMGWYAQAQYRGYRVTAEDQPGPAQAAEALAARLLNSSICTHCGKSVTVNASLPDLCRWFRRGATWVRGCVDEIPEEHRDKAKVMATIANRGFTPVDPRHVEVL